MKSDIYNKYVEIGRVVFISSGKDEGKLAVIVNVIDGNKVSNVFLSDLHFSSSPEGAKLTLAVVFLVLKEEQKYRSRDFWVE